MNRRIGLQKLQRGSWEAAQSTNSPDKWLLREEVAERRGASAKRSLSEEVAQQRKQLTHPSITRSIHSFVHSLICWFMESLVHWFIDSMIRCFVDEAHYILIHWFIDSVIVSVRHWLAGLLIHWFIDSLVYWFLDSFIVHWQFIDSVIHVFSKSFSQLRMFFHVISWACQPPWMCSFVGTSQLQRFRVLHFYGTYNYFLQLTTGFFLFDTSASAWAGHYCIWYL